MISILQQIFINLCKTISEEEDLITYLSIRTNESSDTDNSSISKQFGNLRNSPDVFFTILLGETQVLIQSCPHIVSVQTVGRDALAHQVFLKGKGNCCLSSSGKTSQPDGTTTESSFGSDNTSTLVTTNMLLLEHNIGRLLHRL